MLHEEHQFEAEEKRRTSELDKKTKEKRAMMLLKQTENQVKEKMASGVAEEMGAYKFEDDEADEDKVVENSDDEVSVHSDELDAAAAKKKTVYVNEGDNEVHGEDSDTEFQQRVP